MTRDREGYFEIQRIVQAELGLTDVSQIEEIKGERVRELARGVEQEVTRWIEPYPSIMRNRIPSLSLVFSGMAPETSIEVIATGVKVVVVIFGIDDLVDGTVVEPTDQEAEALATLCEDIVLAHGRVDLHARVRDLSPPLSPDLRSLWMECAESLKRYCLELSETKGASLHYEHFARMFAYGMDGMRVELRARRAFIETQSVPDFETYLEAGRKSILVGAACAAILVGMAPDLDPGELERASAAMDDFVLMAGSVVRLANDVRSYARETEIEQRPNSVLVLMRTRGMSEKEAEAAVIDQADACLASLAPLESSLPEPLRPWARGVRRFASLMRDWYMIRELHG